MFSGQYRLHRMLRQRTQQGGGARVVERVCKKTQSDPEFKQIAAAMRQYPLVRTDLAGVFQL
jgi:hypothetical protein